MLNAFSPVQRVTAATAMNSVSSRSHAIFTLTIEGTRREDASIDESDDAPARSVLFRTCTK